MAAVDIPPICCGAIPMNMFSHAEAGIELICCAFMPEYMLLRLPVEMPSICAGTKFENRLDNAEDEIPDMVFPFISLNMLERDANPRPPICWPLIPLNSDEIADWLAVETELEPIMESSEFSLSWPVDTACEVYNASVWLGLRQSRPELEDCDN
jgi:hypothetical protein